MSIEGEEPNYDQIKQDWIQFWIVRLRYLELLEISKFRSTIWEHVRREISPCSIKNSTDVSPEPSQNYTRRELTDKRYEYDERNSYRFRRVHESPPRQRCNRYLTSRKSFQKHRDRGRSPEQYYRNSKERVDNRSRSRQKKPDLEKLDKEMNITVVSCCCEILGIAEVSESIRTQITALLVLALDYEKHGMHSEEYIMTNENIEFFKLVRNKIKESMEAGHITSKRSNVIEDIIENISILIENRRNQWMSLDKHNAVIASLTLRCISPIRAPSDDESAHSLEDPNATHSSSIASPTWSLWSRIKSPSYTPKCSSIVRIASPMCSLNTDNPKTSEESIKELPSSTIADLSEDIETTSPPIIASSTEVKEEHIKDRLNIVRSLSVNSSLSSDSTTMPPGVSDYELEVMKSKPLTSVSSQDSIVPDEVTTLSEDITNNSTVMEDTPDSAINNDNQEHEYMKDLTDDELKYLLKNFKQLTDDEQQCLIIFLEKIDHSGDENRMKELKNFMLNCEEDPELKEEEISDVNISITESVVCDAPTEVVEHQESTKKIINDIDDTNDPPILPKPEKKQWKTFKVTLNVEESLRKVDLVEDKDAMIDVQMQ